MNANLPPKASKIVIKDWLQTTTSQLSTAGIESARLDAELLLAHHLKVARNWVIAHATDNVRVNPTLKESVHRRLRREPLAYIVGHKEFYGHSFIVTPDVLIPRPESESIVDFIRQIAPRGVVLDIGTGSGCLAISIALSCPETTVHAIDVSQAALAIAIKNADALHAPVTFHTSNLLVDYHGPAPDYIVANLPYVSSSWVRSPETSYEPFVALFAQQKGLELIFTLLDQSASLLSPGAFVVLEADPRQFAAIREKADTLGFSHYHSEGFMIVLRR